MKKPTGPGKIDTSLSAPGAVPGGVVALLFNFDFDDATVKEEHKAFLLQHFVPRLTAAPNLRLFLRGTASQAGDAAYNRQLSRRRVEAVRNFLTGKGVQPGQIDTAFTGEDLSTSLIADDERDRAVKAILEGSTGPARFDRVMPVEALDGFHGRRNPQAMIVGNPEISFVRLIGARGAVVESLTPSVVRVRDPVRPGVAPVVATSDNMLLGLQPGVPGQGQIVARLPGVAQSALDRLAITDDDRRVPFPKQTADTPRRLGIRNLSPRIVSLSFHYVKTAPDKSVGVVTARTPNAALEQELVDEMNLIYSAQTRIRFFRQSQRVVATGFMGPVTDSSHSQFGSNAQITPGIDASALIRIFFVGVIDPRGGEELFASSQGHPHRTILCSDSGKPDGRVIAEAFALGRALAHECGHNFGVRGHSDPDDQHLMHRTSGFGVIIPPDTAELMNNGVLDVIAESQRR